MKDGYQTSGKFPDAKGSGPTKFDKKARERYLNFIRKNGRWMKLAAQCAGVHPTTVREYLNRDPEFSEQFEAALEEFNHRLEMEAHRRAMEGVEEPIVNKDGEIVGHKTIYSDRLMVKLLESNNPDKHRGVQQVDVNHKGGVLLIEGQRSAAELENDLEQLHRTQIDMIEGDSS
jgi:hypothetical protein